MKPGAAQTIAARIRSHNKARPSFTVEEADDGWVWRVYDPRRGPNAIAEGEAETRGHAHVLAHRAILRLPPA